MKATRVVTREGQPTEREDFDIPSHHTLCSFIQEYYDDPEPLVDGTEDSFCTLTVEEFRVIFDTNDHYEVWFVTEPGKVRNVDKIILDYIKDIEGEFTLTHLAKTIGRNRLSYCVRELVLHKVIKVTYPGSGRAPAKYVRL